MLAPKGELDPDSVRRLAADLANLRRAGHEVVLVSSGAIASGFRALGLARPPKLIRLKQAAAAIGQQRLMSEYAAAFSRDSIAVGQVLLTADDFDHRARFLNARHTLETLLAHGIVPIINENDSVSFDEIKLGDNDRLAALTSAMIRADLLVILSSVPGLLGKNGRVIAEVAGIDEARTHLRPEKSGVGTGGMATKLDAAEIVTRVGIPAVIASGDSGGVVSGIIGRMANPGASEQIGTFFLPARAHVDSRRRWIGFSARSRGMLTIDDGAARALRERGASLLPAGVVAIDGDFEAGAVVDVNDKKGRSIARGLVAYSAAEVGKIRGKKASEIESALGYIHCDEVIHRDDLLLSSARSEEGPS